MCLAESAPPWFSPRVAWTQIDFQCCGRAVSWGHDGQNVSIRYRWVMNLGTCTGVRDVESDVVVRLTPGDNSELI